MNKRTLSFAFAVLSGDGGNKQKTITASLTIWMETPKGRTEQDTLVWSGSSVHETVEKICASSGQITVLLSDHCFWLPVWKLSGLRYSTPYTSAQAIVERGEHRNLLTLLEDEYWNQMADSLLDFFAEVRHYGREDWKL